MYDEHLEDNDSDEEIEDDENPWQNKATTRIKNFEYFIWKEKKWLASQKPQTKGVQKTYKYEESDLDFIEYVAVDSDEVKAKPG